MQVPMLGRHEVFITFPHSPPAPLAPPGERGAKQPYVIALFKAGCDAQSFAVAVRSCGRRDLILMIAMFRKLFHVKLQCHRKINLRCK